MCSALSDHTSFTNLPSFLGSLNYDQNRKSRYSLGILQNYVKNEGDAWQLSLDQAKHYYDNILANVHKGLTLPALPSLSGNPVELPVIMQELIGGVYLGMIEKLAERTAEMHLALASLNRSGTTKPESSSIASSLSIRPPAE